MSGDTTLWTAQSRLVSIRDDHTEARKRLFALLRVQEIFVDEEDRKVAMILAQSEDSGPPQYEIVWCMRQPAHPWGVMVNWREPGNAMNDLPDSGLGAVERIVKRVTERYPDLAHLFIEEIRNERYVPPSSPGKEE